jgi:hypothetical protein
MPHNRVGDAAHQRSSYPTKPPTAHHDQARAYVLGNLYDLLRAIPLGYPEMLLSDLTPSRSIFAACALSMSSACSRSRSTTSGVRTS